MHCIPVMMFTQNRPRYSECSKKQGANIKIGEGNVILNEEGTFNNIYLASGNGKVILNKDNSLAMINMRGYFLLNVVAR